MSILLFIAALVVSWLVFTWLLKVVKTTLSTAVTLAALVMLFQVLGIGPNALLQTVLDLPYILGDFLSQIFDQR